MGEIKLVTVLTLGALPGLVPLTKRSNLGNGEGQWPKPPIPGCLQPDAISLSLIIAGQRAYVS